VLRGGLNLKLTSKIVVLLSVVTIGVLGTYATVEIQMRERDLHAESSNTHRLLLGNVVPALSNALWNVDRLAAKAAVVPFFDSKSVVRVEIYSTQGTPFLTFHRGTDGNVEAERSETTSSEEENAFSKRFGFPQSEASIPYSLSSLENVGLPKILGDAKVRLFGNLWFLRDDKPNFVGHVLVEYSTADLVQSIRMFRMRMVVLSAALASSILVFAFAFLQFSVIRRIARLEGASIKVAAGQWTTVQQGKDEDEIGALTRNFNIMVQKLSTSVREIEEKNLQLIQLADLIRDFSLQVDVTGVAEMLSKKFFDLVFREWLAVVSYTSESVSFLHVHGTEEVAFSKDLFQELARDCGQKGGDPSSFFVHGSMHVHVLERGQPHQFIFVVMPSESRSRWSETKSLFAKAVLEASQRAIFLLDGVGERARMDAELTAATAVQNTLLPRPKSFPGFEIASYYQSASTMGGDWFGYHYDEQRKRLYFLIGDVTGHGIPSALVTGLACGGVLGSVYQMVHKDYGESLSVADGLRRMAEVVNHIIYTTGRDAERLMTMVFCCIDANSKEASFLNGGHNHPILAGRERKARSIPMSGSRMGFRDSFSADVKTILLEEGDTILVYTDGLIENKSASGEMMSLRTVLKVLDAQQSPQAIVTDLLKQANSVWAGYPAADDVSLLAVRWIGE
jgi:serine phosphatase RsbU (regulator of sigma subunit)/HAMP domain-containing protein